MAYTKQTWVNNETLVDEDRMNHIENGIYQNAEDISELNQSLSDLQVKAGRIAAGNEIQFTGSYILLCIGYSNVNRGIYFCYGNRADQYGDSNNESLSVTMSSGVCTFTNLHTSAALYYLAFVSP